MLDLLGVLLDVVSWFQFTGWNLLGGLCGVSQGLLGGIYWVDCLGLVYWVEFACWGLLSQVCLVILNR